MVKFNVSQNKKPTGEYLVNPESNQKIEREGRIIVLGNEAQIKKLNYVFESHIK